MLAENRITRLGTCRSPEPLSPYCVLGRDVASGLKGESKIVHFSEPGEQLSRRTKVKETCIKPDINCRADSTMIRSGEAESDRSNSIGFEGDTEDSDTCGRTDLANCKHGAVNKSQSTPSAARVKRRRMKRRSASADVALEDRGKTRNGKSQEDNHLAVPERSNATATKQCEFWDTDSTDIDTDSSINHITSRKIKISRNGWVPGSLCTEEVNEADKHTD